MDPGLIDNCRHQPVEISGVGGQVPPLGIKREKRTSVGVAIVGEEGTATMTVRRTSVGVAVAENVEVYGDETIPVAHVARDVTVGSKVTKKKKQVHRAHI